MILKGFYSWLTDNLKDYTKKIDEIQKNNIEVAFHINRVWRCEYHFKYIEQCIIINLLIPQKKKFLIDNISSFTIRDEYEKIAHTPLSRSTVWKTILF